MYTLENIKTALATKNDEAGNTELINLEAIKEIVFNIKKSKDVEQKALLLQVLSWQDENQRSGLNIFSAFTDKLIFDVVDILEELQNLNEEKFDYTGEILKALFLKNSVGGVGVSIVVYQQNESFVLRLFDSIKKSKKAKLIFNELKYKKYDGEEYFLSYVFTEIKDIQVFKKMKKIIKRLSGTPKDFIENWDIPMTQSHLNNQMKRYLLLVNSDSEIEELGESEIYNRVVEIVSGGMCEGYSVVYKAMEYLGSELWWKNILANISFWDGELKSLSEPLKCIYYKKHLVDADVLVLQDAFEKAINYIIQYQEPEIINSQTSQRDNFKSNGLSVFEILEKNNIKKILNSTCVAGSFSKDMLITFLNNNKDIFTNNFCWIGGGGHATSIKLLEDNTSWVYYDCNFFNYEMISADLNIIIDEIFKSHKSEKEEDIISISLEIASLIYNSSLELNYSNILLKQLVSTESGRYKFGVYTPKNVIKLIDEFTFEAEVDEFDDGFFAGCVASCDMETLTRILYEEKYKIIFEKAIRYRDEPVLFQAVEYKNNSIIKLLIDNGADVKQLNNFGNTILHKAIYSNNNDAIQILLDNTVDVNMKDSLNDTALYSAVVLNFNDAIQILLNNGADVNETSRLGTPLVHMAVLQKNNVALKKIIENGGDVNKRNGFGTLLLSVAIDSGNHDAIKFLLEVGADANLKTMLEGMGDSMLHKAISCNSKRAIEMFINKVYDIDITNSCGETPLYTAIREKNYFIMQELLKRGANVNVKNNYGSSLLRIAIRLKDNKAMEILINYGCDILEKDKKGKILLSNYIVLNKSISLIKIILNKKCKQENKVNVIQEVVKTYFEFCNIEMLNKIFSIIEKNNLDIISSIVIFFAQKYKKYLIYIIELLVESKDRGKPGLIEVIKTIIKDKVSIVKLLQSVINTEEGKNILKNKIIDKYSVKLASRNNLKLKYGLQYLSSKTNTLVYGLKEVKQKDISKKLRPKY